MSYPKAVVVIENSEYSDLADDLASRIGARVLQASEHDDLSDVSFRIMVGANFTVTAGQGRQQRQIAIDFSAPTLQQRVQAGGKDLLLRACGLHKEQHSVRRVMDATAGFGSDTWVLAASGIEVIAVEQDPLVGALLKNALSHACSLGLETAHNIKLVVGDSTLLESKDSIDVVYIDPMFSAGRRKAASSKSMSFLQDWLQDTYSVQDQAALFARACDIASTRVVVKRSVKADFLSSYPPTFQIKGKTHRFDVYQLGGRSA